MLNQKNLHADYTGISQNYQLFLPLNIEKIIPADDPVRLVDAFVEGLNLSDLYQTFDRIRNNSATPRQMLKVMIYAFMNSRFSSRQIEDACRRDINFWFLLAGSPAPDHSTIARFVSLHLARCSRDLLAQMTSFLREIGELSEETVFIDGTKIESCANRYTFVWKKAVTKHQIKKLEKAAAFVQETEEKYGLRVVHNGKVSIHSLKKLRKQLYRLKAEEGIEFVRGVGKRKMPLQRTVEELDGILEKLKEYNHKLHICGNRNSYSRTDEDATFMRTKDDHMKNGQLKPAYNVQHAVDSDYIVWTAVMPNPSDTKTLIPFMREMEEILGFRYRKVTVDAGYESEENYLFLEENGQLAFIKPTNYEVSKTKKYQSDIGRRENMDYNEEKDEYTCHNGQILKATKVERQKTDTGYRREVTVYQCENCKGCPYQRECIKGNNCKTPFEERNKVLNVSKTFEKKRQESLERIRSEEGRLLRINRGIQAEGSFSLVKDGLGFRRYHYRGKENVLAESILLGMAGNLVRLHFKIQSGRRGQHLHPLKKEA